MCRLPRSPGMERPERETEISDDESISDEEMEEAETETEDDDEETENYDQFVQSMQLRINDIISKSEEFLAQPAEEETVIKTNWDDVLEIAEELRKRSVLWIDTDLQSVKDLEDNFTLFFNSLKKLIERAHGATVGAHSSLFVCIERSVNKALHKGVALVKEATKEQDSEERRGKILLKMADFWHSLDELKLTPANNPHAIRSKLVSVTSSIYEELGEIKRISNAFEAGFTNRDDRSELGVIWNNMIELFPSLILVLEDSSEETMTDFEEIVSLIECIKSEYNKVKDFLKLSPIQEGIRTAIQLATQAVTEINRKQSEIIAK